MTKTETTTSNLTVKIIVNDLKAGARAGRHDDVLFEIECGIELLSLVHSTTHISDKWRRSQRRA